MRSACKLILFIIITYYVLVGTHAIAQELSAYEEIDNQSVGLTVAPFAKAGQCLVDIDNNGWQDIYCLKYNGGGYSRIYLNDEGMFTDVTANTPLEDIEDIEGIRTFTPVMADFDNDGDKDLSFGTNLHLHLLRNDDNVFTDVAEEMGFIGPQPPGFIATWYLMVGGWADYDLDGDLDCIVFQQNNKNVYLFRNDGDQFTDVASEAGLDSTELSEEPFSNPLVWEDIDGDGDPDLHGRYNFFLNEDGVFHDVSDSIGLGDLSEIVNREFFDYDNDGDLDFFKITPSAENTATNELWENKDGLFVNVTDDVGLGIMKDRYRGLSIGDFDNDGDQDIFIQLNIFESPDLLLVNDLMEDGSRVFANVARFVGIEKVGDRKGGGFFDYDRDGFLDIYIPSAEYDHLLYHNLGINEANWVGFILEGTVSNRDAVGSSVTLYYAKGKQFRYTKCGNGWLRQDNPWVHFGIGYETTIDSVVIRWPLGYKQTLTDVAINQYNNIKEPDLSGVKSEESQNGHPSGFGLAQNYPNPFNPTTTINFTLSKTSHVKLTIYDLIGKEIRTLVRDEKEAGNYTINWDGRNNMGNIVASGIYIYQLEADNFTQSKKMTFIK
ncbi:T9SS type A sorting domain-containing protein [candidate division KSB1 bacterium]|nr:T9SS type A sorting domain-containing protein [candidate division KSB1 bacterium]